MIPSPPSDDALRALFREHAHRHPIKSSITVIGDGGKPVRLPMVIGNPAGACAMPEGTKVSRTWTTMLASAMGMQEEPANLATSVVMDVMLWPEPAIVGAWLARWPGLAKSIVDLVTQKVAIASNCIVEPAFDASPPPVIEEALAKNPTAAWREYRPHGAVYHVVINPPAPAAWRLYGEALKKAKADPWPVVSEAALGCVLVCVDEEGKTVDVGGVFLRWPGLVALTAGEMATLAGTSAEVHLGEW